ncbi:MAG: proprotein convertase P, partial [Flavobacteriaceae bacterium]
MGIKLRLLFAITMLFICFSGYTQQTDWQRTERHSGRVDKTLVTLKVQNGTLFSLNERAYAQKIRLNTSSKVGSTVYFPNRDGTMVPFKIVEKPVLSEALTRKYPTIRSYHGVSLEGPKREIRFSVSHKGIQAS